LNQYRPIQPTPCWSFLQSDKLSLVSNLTVNHHTRLLVDRLILPESYLYLLFSGHDLDPGEAALAFGTATAKKGDVKDK